MSIRRVLTSLIVANALAITSCAAPEDDVVEPNIVVLDKRADALTSAQILSLNGTYTTCSQHTGSWSVAVASGATLTNSALAVIKGDTNCALAISSVVTSGGTYTANTANLALATSYGTARSFGNPVQFYANAILSNGFTSDFTLTLLFSADPTLNTQTKATSYATVTATTVTATGVAAPNYTLDLSGVTVTADINNLVTSVSGNISLTGSATGTSYAITNNSAGVVADTYTAIDAKFTGLTSTPMGTITGLALLPLSTNLTLNATSAVRVLIIANTSNSVNSYQKFTITFSPPT